MAIDPARYQDYAAGKISREQAEMGYKGPITINPNPVNIYDSGLKLLPFIPGLILNNGPIMPLVPINTPAVYETSVTPYPTGKVPAAVQANTSARDLRQQAMNRNVWSNDTTIAVLEQKSWAIYVETGRWDTPEQQQYHDQSESIRKGLNPLYPGSPDGKPQNDYILPTDQFVTANGMDTKGLLTYGALGLGAVMILSMFRR